MDYLSCRSLVKYLKVFTPGSSSAKNGEKLVITLVRADRLEKNRSGKFDENYEKNMSEKFGKTLGKKPEWKKVW